ncbi:ABC transporter permease [Ekhidna sp. To15]|uniref:ABC transporter permease n=1 Tax=Ekhidna sp. To15 TaxID=3395267 RepID=UPI003F5249FB
MNDNKIKPPGWIQKLVSRYCEPYLFEGISGDLEELFFENVELKGPRKAKIIYLFQAIGFFRMRFKKQSKRVSNMKAIWSNYLLTSFRSLKRHKSFFAINLIGLITAITCSLFALIYVYDELQFDKQHSDVDKTYRLYKHYVNPAENIDHLTYETSGMMGPTMTDEYAEVQEYIRVCPWFSKAIISFNENNFGTENLYFADSTFFDFFDFPLLKGDPSTVLTAPSSIVISESLAKAIFADQNPIGQVVVGLHDLNYTVTGVFADVERSSSMQFDALISWSTTVPNVGPLAYRWMNNWLSQGIFTFVKLSEGTSPEGVEEKLPDMMNMHFEERAENYFLQLMPLKKMYLYGDNIRDGRSMKAGSITFVYTLSFSALLVFLIASVNYINIMLSRATETHTEVGVRKVMGSTRRQLVGRFVAETFISTSIATIVSIVLLVIIIPQTNPLLGKELAISALFQPLVVGAAIGFILTISIFVGLYPAIVISSPPISSILQGSSSVGSTGWFRKILLTFQYAFSIFLIVCTIVVIKQTNYLKNKPLGFDKEQVMVIDVNNELDQKIDVFEAELLKNPNIQLISTSRSAIGSGTFSTTVFPEGYTDEVTTRIFGVDQDFFDTYGMELNYGRTFFKKSLADSNNLVVNQAMVDHLGWEDPIGKHIRFSSDGQPATIIGVVDDFHYGSLATATIEPTILYLNTVTIWNSSVKISGANKRETIAYILDVWDNLASRTPIDFYFVDEWFDRQYQKETQLLGMSTIYSIISILLCALGLYGLTALLLQQKQKEISIRKVLGASVSSIVSLVNRQFVVIILISFAIATPLAYYLINQWLDAFVYKISMDLFAFGIAGIITLLISVSIVSTLSMRTANTNPSKTLSRE